jgi:very-short-patch-repair endonuclease
LGVVTPFTAHKDWLRERIEALGLSSDVLVDSAYGFQGDERDIMIFSPVVARGITSSASRWVESPPNLVNVALTRAREALFVVADFDYCLQQEGILRKLALYCRDIQLLRDTSPAEVELFSWMIVQGWTPKVHPRIGDIEADFELVAESGQKIAIEVDGAVHHDGRKEADKARDAFLNAQGYRILRFPARAVLETPFEVVSVIGKALKS